MNKKWIIQEPNIEQVMKISEELKISQKLAVALLNRNVAEKEDIEMFLNPTRKNFHDPFLLNDMKIAVERIIKAIENKEKVIIYGDYDVDGITSITVLKKFLADRGLEVDYYIPHRLEEGYGLNKTAIEWIAENGYTLVITVDCGVSGIEEIDLANSLGVDFLVTDHHEPLEGLPKAIAVINPKRADNTYPFRGLAGVGVVFKLIQAIGMTLNLDEKEYLKYLDIVCIGTISDIVPLIDENRVITKLGLKLIEVTKNLGLKVLMKACGCKEINSTIVSFGIAPRINACGRMGGKNEVVELFLTDSIEEAEEFTKALNNYNVKRQEKEKVIFEQAVEKIEKTNQDKNSSIVIVGDNWHHGVIGIVASKLVEKYYKPSILLSLEDGIAKGSGRSITGFDLHKALVETSAYLQKYGGHEMAVGLSLKQEDLPKFQKAFEEIAIKENVNEIIPYIYLDGEITIEDMTEDFLNELKMLEPFGEKNPIPMYVYRNLKIDSIRALTEGKHLKLTLKDGSSVITAIGFNKGNLVDDYIIGDKVDIVGILELNSYNGVNTVQINLKDIMKSI